MALTFLENTGCTRRRELALTDELTGLANRRLFHERLDAELAGRATRALAVAIVDLDRFKELNDTLGHHAGDLLLAQLGPRLHEVVGDAGLVARWAGTSSRCCARRRAGERCRALAPRRDALQTPFEIDGLELVRTPRSASRCPGGRHRRRGAAAARRRRDVPGQGGAHGSRSTTPRATGTRASGWR